MKQQTTLVVDSSVIIKWLNRENEEFLEQANKILQRVEKGLVNIITPELSKYEAGNALLNKGLDINAFQASLEFLYKLPINFIPLDEEMAKETADIALNRRITFYDASFLALAKKRNARLITDNIKHQKPTPSSEIKVIALKNYR